MEPVGLTSLAPTPNSISVAPSTVTPNSLVASQSARYCGGYPLNLLVPQSFHPQSLKTKDLLQASAAAVYYQRMQALAYQAEAAAYTSSLYNSQGKIIDRSA